MRRKTKPTADYEPLDWSESTLSAEEQECWEAQRRDLWRHGLRGEQLELMACEFAYAITCNRLAKKEAE